jgi:hypothetical protein
MTNGTWQGGHLRFVNFVFRGGGINPLRTTAALRGDPIKKILAAAADR